MYVSTISMSVQKNTFLPLLSLVGLILSSCAGPETQQAPNLTMRREISHKQLPVRVMQIFFDGTSNKWSNRTNVRRRFEAAAIAEDPTHPCLYVEGVGNNSLSGAHASLRDTNLSLKIIIVAIRTYVSTASVVERFKRVSSQGLWRIVACLKFKEMIRKKIKF
jgi:hypothetical protein